MTVTSLKTTNVNKQLEVMSQWFYANYANPIEDTPWDDGAYIYIWGGPYDPEEELQQEFSGFVPDKVIARLANELRDISSEWTKHIIKPQYTPNLPYDDEHPLHDIIGQYLCSIPLSQNDKLLLAPECGGYHNLPLFSSSQRARVTQYCNVDALILQNNKIRIIFEIEESGLLPTKICGKFLTSALSTNLIHNILNNQSTPLANKVCFIQVIDSSKLPPNSSKIQQGGNLEASIQSILPVNSVCKYKLLFCKGFQGFSRIQSTLESVIQDCLTKPCT